MNKIPLNYIVFTSTKGHWGIKTRQLETYSHLNQQFPISNFAANYCNIAVSDGEDDIANNIEISLNSCYNTKIIKQFSN